MILDESNCGQFLAEFLEHHNRLEELFVFVRIAARKKFVVYSHPRFAIILVYSQHILPINGLIDQ